MTYYVEGLLKLSDEESRVRRFGEYATLEDAIKGAEQLIDDFLLTKVQPEMTYEVLFAIYRNSGEIPVIFRDGDRTLNVSGFNHFKHAMLRAKAICQMALPTLISDDEFEVLKQQRHQDKRSDYDRWDAREIPKAPALTDGLPESTLEQRFAHIAQRIVSTWPSEACARYIKLVMSDKTLREELPDEVVNDLVILHEINKMRLSKNE